MTEENKCCLTCKWPELTEDNWDKEEKDGGRRLLFECGRRRICGEDRVNLPLMLTVIERESVPSMKKETSFMATFWCCHWEG